MLGVSGTGRWEMMGEVCKSCGVSEEITKKVVGDLGDFVEDALMGSPMKGSLSWERSIAVSLGIPGSRVDVWLDCPCGRGEGE